MAKYTAPESRESLSRKVASGRYSLMLIMIFTVVNLVMVMLDAGSYMLFSISVPYYLTSLGKGIDNGFVDGPWDINGTFTITGLVISVIVLALYLLCWLLSKKRSGWLTAALVLIILDTVALAFFTFALLENPAANLMDFLIHAWMIWDLARGIGAASKLKKLPQDTDPTQQELFDGIPNLEASEETLDL